LPNNTFHKLFNPNEKQNSGSSIIEHKNSPHGSIRAEDFRMPASVNYQESPH
jgi:hypothetical protein